MPLGTVKWFDLELGSGIVIPEDGTGDLKVTLEKVETAGLFTLLEGERISYRLVEHPDGMRTGQIDRLKPVQD
ncbi:MAG: cold-shock protein [Ponticaulis sp.]|nr:cold-shock protein [Ponticaulis sp.]